MADFWAPPPTPKTRLGRHRQLAPLAGIHVSPICLGAMSVGDKWGSYMGTMDKAQSFKLLDAFYHAGGNFIDTANTYQDESSEEFIGEWMEQRGNRDQMIIATKARLSTSSRIAPSSNLCCIAVHHQFQTCRGGHRAEGALCWEQHEGVASFGRSFPQEAQD